MSDRYLFVLADRKHTTIVTFYGGFLENYTEVHGLKVPQEVKANKNKNFTRTDKFSRDVHEHLNKHLKLISKKVDKFIEAKPVNAVFVGGNRSMLHLIKKYLNPNLQKRFAGEFVIGLKIPQNETLKRCKEVASQFAKAERIN